MAVVSAVPSICFHCCPLWPVLNLTVRVIWSKSESDPARSMLKTPEGPPSPLREETVYLHHRQDCPRNPVPYALADSALRCCLSAPALCAPSMLTALLFCEGSSSVATSGPLCLLRPLPGLRSPPMIHCLAYSGLHYREAFLGHAVLNWTTTRTHKHACFNDSPYRRHCMTP